MNKRSIKALLFQPNLSLTSPPFPKTKTQKQKNYGNFIQNDIFASFCKCKKQKQTATFPDTADAVCFLFFLFFSASLSTLMNSHEKVIRHCFKIDFYREVLPLPLKKKEKKIVNIVSPKIRCAFHFEVCAWNDS